MATDLEQIRNAAAGLHFISESDYPFELVTLDASASLPQAVVALSGQTGEASVEIQTLDYFFRNMVRVDAAASTDNKATAQRFIALQAVLNASLTDIKVYRIGAVQVDAFIIGKLPDSRYAGLRTKLIET